MPLDADNAGTILQFNLTDISRPTHALIIVCFSSLINKETINRHLTLSGINELWENFAL